MGSRVDVARVGEILGYEFADRSLCVAACTHPSAVEGQPASASYERLEFLGDSVLGAIVASEVFSRYPGMDQGQLSQIKIALVSGDTLARVAEGLGLGGLIVFGESELGTGERGLRHALEDVYEALVGALYVDGGPEAAGAFVARTLLPLMSADLATRSVPAKSRLQEVAQRDFHCAPEYKLEGATGPAHQPTFASVVLVGGRRVGRGTGSTKKESQTAAAADALVRMGYDEGADRPGEDGPCTSSL